MNLREFEGKWVRAILEESNKLHILDAQYVDSNDDQFTFQVTEGWGDGNYEICLKNRQEQSGFCSERSNTIYKGKIGEGSFILPRNGKELVSMHRIPYPGFDGRFD